MPLSLTVNDQWKRIHFLAYVSTSEMEKRCRKLQLVPYTTASKSSYEPSYSHVPSLTTIKIETHYSAFLCRVSFVKGMLVDRRGPDVCLSME